MRQVVTAGVTGLLLALPAAAGSHSGHGPALVDIRQFAFQPANVTIVQGDSVLWNWKGPDTNHSVTADPGQAVAFDSDPGTAPAAVAHPVGDGYGFTFDRTGRFTYHCKVHPSMTGAVTVDPAPPPVVAAAPKLTRVSAKPRTFRRATTLRFRVDGPVTIRAMLRKGRRLVREIDFAAPPGSRSRRLDFGRVKPGRYVLRVVAVDTAGGRSSKPASLPVVVR